MQEKSDKVRILLCQYHLTYAWLMSELDKIGISVDKSSLSEILTGRRKRNKAVIVLDGSLEVLGKYGKCYAGQ